MVLGNIMTLAEIHVYDHKMLWRANLYIDEGQGDWNNLHSWDSVDNDWNYSFDGKTFTEGDGGQNLSFRNENRITPLRQSGIVSQVSYDYPDASRTISNSVDSPFDFFYKMYSQQHYLIDDYEDCPDNDQIELWAKKQENPLLEEERNVTASELKDWGSLYAPIGNGNSHWMNYGKESADFSEYDPYLPGLGLLHHSRSHVFDSQKDWFNSMNAAVSHYSAGADCVGFVLGASEYEDAPYLWNGKLDDDIAETYASSGVMGEFEERSRPGNGFNAFESQYHRTIVSRTGIKDGDPEDQQIKNYFVLPYTHENGLPESEFRNHQVKFLQIKPGDIIQYQGESCHIGIIHSVDINAILEATSIVEMMQAITTIESVYGSKVSYVIHRNMLVGIDGVEFMENETGTWHQDWSNNLRSWSIDRLEVSQ